MFQNIVTKQVYIRKRIFRFRMNPKKSICYEKRIHFVPFSTTFDSSPKQFIAIRKNVNASLSRKV